MSPNPIRKCLLILAVTLIVTGIVPEYLQAGALLSGFMFMAGYGAGIDFNATDRRGCIDHTRYSDRAS